MEEEEEPAVEQVSVVPVSPLRLGRVIPIDADEFGCTNLGMMGNNLISFGRGV